MTPVVEVAGLTRHFGAHRGVVDLSFAIGSGEVFGFLGPNGAGKSTTIRLLLGLIRPTSGTARVFGLDPVQDAVAVHRRTGYLAGDLALYPRLTGRQHRGIPVQGSTSRRRNAGRRTDKRTLRGNSAILPMN